MAKKRKSGSASTNKAKHVATALGITDMHPNWEKIASKWPNSRIRGKNAKINVESCRFIGEGPHELAVYSFGRYLRLAEHKGNEEYPLCVTFNDLIPDYVSTEEPALRRVESAISGGGIGMPEPVHLLGIISCKNGPAFRDKLWDRIEQEALCGNIKPNERWIMSSTERVLDAAKDVMRQEKIPEFVKVPSSGPVVITLSASDLSPEQFSTYEPTVDEASSSRDGNWIYLTKQSIKKGAGGRADKKERVVLKEDFRRVHESLYCGQLGWTIPDPGFFIKKSRESLWINVRFDSGQELAVNVWWIHFVDEEHAESVSSKIIRGFRNSPYDADPEVAKRWHRVLPYYDPDDVAIVGQGIDEVYAYTFLSCMEESRLKGDDRYPMKIGYTGSVEGALQRINGQFSRGLASDAKVQFIGRCTSGRATEIEIHRHLREEGRKIKDAPGTEWYSTSAKEVETLFRQYRT